MGKVQVGILMGSASDWPRIEQAGKTLDDFGIGYEVRVISAHRTPSVAAEYATGAEDRGLKVIVAAAGCAAHLAGVLAAHTVLPVIGIPVEGGALNGFDALLSTVQMPGGIPVATVAVGKGGPINAALLAVAILATADDELRGRLHEYREKMEERVRAADAQLQEQRARPGTA